ncbi:hypothetical protein SDC9_61054 [bioreactor metagenome]|uniref:Uncharacterized protein n=1 Tax=bioreactor metagenome TaxID=1076179 RepID=A0A644XEP0_9ZZZZ
MNIKFLLLLLGISLLMYSCGGDNEAVISRIAPPVKNVDAGKVKFLVDPTKDTLLKIESGSSIFIPANTLVDADNKPCEGPAEIRFEEYLNQADIILSGIPMEYDSAGESYIFESAGMFTIDALSENGEKLGIAEGKTVTVSQISTWADKSSGYNFYQFDTVAGQWRYLTTQVAEPAAPEPAIIETEKSADVKIKKSVRTVDDFVFDIDVNYTMYSELASMKDIMWKFSGNSKYPDPEKEQWIFDRTWPETTIERDQDQKGAYIIALRSSNTSFTTSVLPVSIDPATDGDIAAQAEKSVSLLGTQTAQMLVYDRTMQLSNFGVCNWDRIFAEVASPKKVHINFSLDGRQVPASYRIYQVYTNNNAVAECMPDKNSYVSLVPDVSLGFVYIAIDSDGNALVGRNTSRLYKASGSEPVDFELVKDSRVVKSRDDLLDIVMQV